MLLLIICYLIAVGIILENNDGIYRYFYLLFTVPIASIIYFIVGFIMSRIELILISKDIKIGKFKINKKIFDMGKVKRVIYLETVSFYDISTNKLIHEYKQGTNYFTMFNNNHN